MMEQADSRKRHHHIIAVRSSDNVIVTNRTARLCYNRYAGLPCTLNVVTERKERIRADCNVSIFRKPFFLFFARKYFRTSLKNILPFSVCKYVLIFLTDVHIDGIIPVRTLNSVNKLKSQNLRTLAKPPVVSFLTGKARTMNAALLPGTDTDCLSVLYVADAV